MLEQLLVQIPKGLWLAFLIEEMPIFIERQMNLTSNSLLPKFTGPIPQTPGIYSIIYVYMYTNGLIYFFILGVKTQYTFALLFKWL